jgi:Ni,Fe-hydrogenase III large subunit
VICLNVEERRFCLKSWNVALTAENCKEIRIRMKNDEIIKERKENVAQMTKESAVKITRAGPRKLWKDA